MEGREGRGAGLVASVSGTACMEAGVLGVPAVTFGKLFFAPILLRSGFDPFSTSHREMAALIGEAERMRADPDRDRRIEDFLSALIANSFEGMINDPVSDPACMDADNIRRVAEATFTLMRKSPRAALSARRRAKPGRSAAASAARMV